jgi:hypothetical protein
MLRTPAGSGAAAAVAALVAAASLQLAMAAPAIAQGRSHAAEGAGVSSLPAKPKAADPAVAGTPAAAATRGNGTPGSHSHISREGGHERRLWIDSGRVVEFGDDGTPAIRAAAPGELDSIGRGGDAAAAGSKSLDPATGSPLHHAASGNPVSPVFRDASGRPRALPGGVIVSLKQPMADDQARSALEAAGLVPLRRIGERMWLVDSPAGIAALELANRLQEEGRFGFAQPNWWQPKATK